MSAPLNRCSILTEAWELDIMHRRAGRDARPVGKTHADAHKYCTLGRCGTRPGPYSGGHTKDHGTRKETIIAWRKAKARANRAYLEEEVYAKAQDLV